EVLTDTASFPGFVGGDRVAIHDGQRVGWRDHGRWRWTEPLCPVRIEAARTHRDALWVVCRAQSARIGTLTEPGPPIPVPGHGAVWSTGEVPVLGTFDGQVLTWRGSWVARDGGV